MKNPPLPMRSIEFDNDWSDMNSLAGQSTLSALTSDMSMRLQPQHHNDAIHQLSSTTPLKELLESQRKIYNRQMKAKGNKVPTGKSPQLMKRSISLNTGGDKEIHLMRKSSPMKQLRSPDMSQRQRKRGDRDLLSSSQRRRNRDSLSSSQRKREQDILDILSSGQGRQRHRSKSRSSSRPRSRPRSRSSSVRTGSSSSRGHGHQRSTSREQRHDHHSSSRERMGHTTSRQRERSRTPSSRQRRRTRSRSASRSKGDLSRSGSALKSREDVSLIREAEIYRSLLKSSNSSSTSSSHRSYSDSNDMKSTLSNALSSLSRESLSVKDQLLDLTELENKLRTHCRIVETTKNEIIEPKRMMRSQKTVFGNLNEKAITSSDRDRPDEDNSELSIQEKRLREKMAELEKERQRLTAFDTTRGLSFPSHHDTTAQRGKNSHTIPFRDLTSVENKRQQVYERASSSSFDDDSSVAESSSSNSKKGGLTTKSKFLHRISSPLRRSTSSSSLDSKEKKTKGQKVMHKLQKTVRKLTPLKQRSSSRPSSPCASRSNEDKPDFSQKLSSPHSSNFSNHINQREREYEPQKNHGSNVIMAEDILRSLRRRERSQSPMSRTSRSTRPYEIKRGGLDQQQHSSISDKRLLSSENSYLSRNSSSENDNQSQHRNRMQKAGLIWKSLVSGFLQFPTEMQLRQPEVNSAPWKYVSRFEVLRDAKLEHILEKNRKINKKRTGSDCNLRKSGALILHLIIRDESSWGTCEDIVVGCFNPNADALVMERHRRQVASPSSGGGSSKIMWMASRRSVRYPRRNQYLQQLMNFDDMSNSNGRETMSPLGSNKDICNSNVVSVSDTFFFLLR